MSKEVKRYDPLLGLARNAKLRRMDMQCDPQWVLDLAAERDALLAERDALKGQVETLTGWYANSLDVVNEVTAILPGAHYMDPPDGGDVSVPEQVRRMAKDAERYRRMRAVVIAEREGCTEELYDNECDRLLEAYDAALQGEQP